MKIFVPLAEGFEEIEAISIIDILRRANNEVITFSISSSKQVTGAHNITIEADKTISQIDFTEGYMIVLPGGMPGTNHLNNHEGLRTVIKEYAISNKLIGAICAAPIVLGGLGILDGLKATCYPGYENQLKGADYSLDSVIISKNIITSRGPGTALDFALKLVEIANGKELAEKLRQATISK